MSPVRLLDLIDALDNLVRKARLDRHKIYEVLDDMRASLPDEIRIARLILQENPDALERAREKLHAPAPDARASTDADGPGRLLVYLATLDEMVHQAKRIPFSDERRIDAERFRELLDQARDSARLMIQTQRARSQDAPPLAADDPGTA